MSCVSCRVASSSGGTAAKAAAERKSERSGKSLRSMSGSHCSHAVGDGDDHEELHGIEDPMRDDARNEVARAVERDADDDGDDRYPDEHERLPHGQVSHGKEGGGGDQADALLQPAAE